jgi:hypothetical protein
MCGEDVEQSEHDDDNGNERELMRKEVMRRGSRGVEAFAHKLKRRGHKTLMIWDDETV